MRDAPAFSDHIPPIPVTPDALAALDTPRAFFGENRTAALIDDLARQGWAHAADALPADLTAALLTRARDLSAAEALEAGKIGRGEAEMRALAIRRARIAWMDGTDPGEARFLEGAEALRRAINEALFAGLFEFEAHFAVYPTGGHYARHLDAFAGVRRSRVVSLVAWLNPDWRAGDGGELDLWGSDTETGEPARTFVPRGGDLLLMMSETIPHAVRPTLRPRHGLAGWFRVNPGVGGVLDPPA